MSSLTKPSKASYGDLRFPPNDRGPGEVKTYTLSKEEIRKRYGITLQERISKKELYRMRQKGMSNRDIAEKYRVDPEAIKALFQRYALKK